MAGSVTFSPHPSDPITIASPWSLQEGIPSGTVVPSGSHSTWVYTPGGAIERVLGTVVTTLTNSDLYVHAVGAHPLIADYGPSYSGTWQAGQQHWSIQRGDGKWPSSRREVANLYLQWGRTSSDLTLSSDATIWWGNLAVFHRRFGWDGYLVDVAANLQLTTQGLVYDLIGRGLRALLEFDPGSVPAGMPWANVIQHAAWWNGVSAREVLDLAVTSSPRMRWEILDPGPSGLPRLRIGRWDGPVRYILPPGSVRLQMSGGGATVANRCLVRYVGTTYGQTKTVWVHEVRCTVPILDDAGLTRTMTLDVTGEGLITTEQARLRGAAALRLSSMAKTSGTAVVREAIYDRVQGRMVEPWEIVPGSTVIVADAPLSWSRSTSLTDGISEDGTAVFRLQSAAFDAGRGEATLNLDGGARTLIGRVKAEAAQRRYDVPDTRT